MKKTTAQKMAGALLPAVLVFGFATTAFAETSLDLNVKTNISGSAGTGIGTEMRTGATATTSALAEVLSMFKVRILAAARRVNTIADMMTTIDVKLQERITNAKNSGKDLTAVLAAETDMKLAVADAKVQAQAAIAGSAGLVVGSGDKSKRETNQAALKTARAALRTAEADLHAARKDLKIMIGGLRASSEAKVSADVRVQQEDGEKEND